MLSDQIANSKSIDFQAMYNRAMWVESGEKHYIPAICLVMSDTW